jgi:hypothetical protein
MAGSFLLCAVTSERRFVEFDWFSIVFDKFEICEPKKLRVFTQESFSKSAAAAPF